MGHRTVSKRYCYKRCIYIYLPHMVLPWDAHELLGFAGEAFLVSVASTGHGHVHCKFPGSYNKKLLINYKFIYNLIFNSLNSCISVFS